MNMDWGEQLATREFLAKHHSTRRILCVQVGFMFARSIPINVTAVARYGL